MRLQDRLVRPQIARLDSLADVVVGKGKEPRALNDERLDGKVERGPEEVEVRRRQTGQRP